MNNNFILLMLCIFLCSSSTLAQTAYVKVRPITKYDFRISNHAPVDIEIELSGIETFTLKAGQQRVFESKRVNRTTTMRLFYKESTYNRIKAQVVAKGYRLETEDILADEIYQKTMKNVQNIGPTKVIRKVGFGGYYLDDDYSARNVTSMITAGMYGAKKSSIEQEKLANDQLAMVNTALYLAASKQEENVYSNDFDPIYILPLVKSKILISPVAKFEGNWRLGRKDLNEYWSKNSKDATWGLTFARRIGGEKRLGNTLNLATLYGFASWNKESFGLNGGNVNSYFVDSSYVKFPDKGFYQLRTAEYVNLSINRFSLGLMAEMYFYPSLFFNVRVGYNAFTNSNIEFEKKDNEDLVIGHLNAPNEFNHSKNKKAILLEGGKLYGEARLGLYLSKAQKRMPRKGYYITVGYQIKPRTTYSFGSNHALYHFTDNNLNRVPVMDSNDSKYRSEWTLSFGMAL